ncbi:carbohydrate kinase [Mycobacterium antarcticum]|uniref:FGGY family carbohydrate kinase n=1 Tax=Mycolicibacterium sp. TUM20983 TaxID=3023369 RepID=UPI00238E9608|nr:FGGY family carbohydrate kinase [Mycolicibacterium sp. TUM20983]GLP76688.1 carbohydrate kinase [Mycolicibacterium sp. TUM20983]
MAVLAIDQGTSGTKAVVVDDSGAIRGIAETPVRPCYLAGGRVEQDPAGLLASVLEAGRRAIASADVRVDAVSVANQGETVLVWDPDTGQQLSTALVWQDRRAETLCSKRSRARRWVAERTGLVLDPYFSAPKMTWLRENVSRRGVVTTTDSWIVHHLTGAFVTDGSTASRSLLTDLDSLTWDSDLVGLFDLAGERLPEIVASDAVVGTTDAFGPTVAVGGLIVDQTAALLAQRCLSPGTAKCTFGTGVFLLANVGSKAIRSTAGLTCSSAWTLRGESTYCVDGQAYTAASAVRWLQDIGLIDAPTDLDAIAENDSRGVLFIPALAGLAAPWWRSDATATFTGMTLSTTRADLVTAVVQGLAAQTAELVTAIEDDLVAPLTTLRVDGGLTRSRALMQTTADLTGIPVEVYPSAHATALGAAACARLAVRPDLTVDEAIPHWTPATTYNPRWDSQRANSFRQRWRAAMSATTTTTSPTETVNA